MSKTSSSITLTFRSVRSVDCETLLALMRELQKDDPWSAPFREEGVRRVVLAMLEREDAGQAWFVCDGDDHPLGYIVLCFDYSLEYGGKGAWIDEVFVEAQHRGQGIGAQLLEFAEEQARSAGATVMHLEVNHGNQAIELYRRQGFVDHKRYLMTKWLQT